MEIETIIGIGIILAVGIFIYIRKNSVAKDHEVIDESNAKKDQFNPEKVSGIMPNEKESRKEKNN